MKTTILALCAGLVLAACSSPHPSFQPLSNNPAVGVSDEELSERVEAALREGNYGKKPKNVEEKIKAWAEDNLKDAASAKYKNITLPIQEYIIQNRAPVLGYSVCADINAKNSYGGYVGYTKYWFMFVDGEIVRSMNLESPKKIAGIVIPAGQISVNHFAKCK